MRFSQETVSGVKKREYSFSNWLDQCSTSFGRAPSDSEDVIADDVDN